MLPPKKINTNLIINIDREIGSRICWLLTQTGKLTRRKITPPKKIKKILFVKISEIGSTILAYPALRRAKQLFPQAKLFFLTFKGNEEMMKILKMVPSKNTFSLDIFSLPRLVSDTSRVVRKLRKEKIDAVVDLELFSRISAILGFLVKSPFQVGFHGYQMEGLYRGGFLTHKILYNHYLHTSLAFLSLVESLAHQPEEEIPLIKKALSKADLSLPRIKSSPREKKKILKRISQSQPAIQPGSKLVIFNTRGGDFLALRRWPPERFIQLGKRLLKKPKIALVLTGLKNDWDYNQKIATRINNPFCINLAGLTTLPELLTLFNLGHLLITNDSGPAHFAALTPIYIITLFGPETSLLYSPLSSRNLSLSAELSCSPCVNAYNTRRSPCDNNLCLQKISVNQVFKQAEAILKKPSPQPNDKTTLRLKNLGLAQE